ncbi:MAG: hypothetical protein FJ134_02195 [Deltaproteobacteria bacterium]|nr:hypothetical protein [Deltaproteobacteria bacterium]
MEEIPPFIVMSRGRRIDLRGPHYYQDMLTGIAQEILGELAELEKLDLSTLAPEDFDQVVGITQIRLLNELYFCLGQLRARGVELEPKQAIQDLRDIWNRFIDGTGRPPALKFQVEAGAETLVQ